MSRYRDHATADDERPRDGERAFGGVNQKLDRALLPAGMVHRAENVRFTRALPETRPGVRTPAPMNGGDFGGPILGSGVFADPDGEPWLLLVSAAGLWRTRDGSLPQPVAVAPEVMFEGRVEIVQAFDRVLLFQEDATPVVWRGEVLDAAAPASQEDPGDGTSPIPNAAWGILLANRLLVPVGRDRIAISDILDYTRYDRIFGEYRVNAGADDSIVALFPDPARQAVAVFKERSIFLVSSIYGDLADVRVDEVNGRVGCAARRSVARVGAEAFFLSGTGVYALGEVIEGRMATTPVALSDPIEPFFRERVNWNAISNACSAVHGGYYWLALPIDGSGVNNALLRFNTVTRQWEGHDTFAAAAGMQIDALHLMPHNGELALYGVDYANGRILLFGEGFSDIIDGEEYPIAFTLETRAYGAGDPDRKEFRGIGVDVETWQPGFSVAMLFDGVNEELPLVSGATRDRRKFLTFGGADYDETNGNDDHAAPYREDYSIALADEDAEFDPQAGVKPERRQIVKERYALRARAQWAAVRIQNSGGYLRVRGIDLEWTGGERAPRRAA